MQLNRNSKEKINYHRDSPLPYRKPCRKVCISCFYVVWTHIGIHCQHMYCCFCHLKKRSNSNQDIETGFWNNHLKLRGGFWSFDVKRIEIIWLGFSTYVEILIFNVNIEVHKSVFRLPIQVWNCYFTMDQLKVKWGNNCTSQAHLSKIQTDGV